MEIRVDQIEKRSWIDVNLNQLKKNFEIYKQSLKKDSQIIRYKDIIVITVKEDLHH